MREKWVGALASVLAVVTALAIGFVAIAAVRQDVWVAVDAYWGMVKGGLGDFGAVAEGADRTILFRAWGESAVKAAILLLTGLSVAVAFTVGLFNIGAQGQLVVGAIAAAAIGAKLDLPVGLHPVLCLLAAALCGAAYAWLPAWLKLRRGVHEVISTIMLNWVALRLVEGWLVVGPLAATAPGTHSISGTDDIFPSAQLPRLLEGSRLHAGVVLAAVLALLVWLWLSRTKAGFEARAVGAGQEAARAAGMDVDRRTRQAMMAAGALAGLAGALLVLGTELKYPATLGGTYGFDGIAIALIGQGHPAGIAAAAALFGTLRAGGTWMQLYGVHKSFPELIQGLALLLVAGRVVFEALLRSRKRPLATTEVPRA
jgi:simple sugar transport system permease protein